MERQGIGLLTVGIALVLAIGACDGGSSPNELDGTRIAFESAHDIYVMNTDGSGQTRLTDDPASDTGPSLSLDGTKIAFYSDRDGNFEIPVMGADGSDQTRLTDSPDWDGNFEIYVMNADGSNQTRLTDNPAWDADPSWGPGR